METVDLVGLLVPITYFVFLITERLWPARAFPPRRGWQWIGLWFLVMVLTLSTLIPLLLPEPWLAQHCFLDGTRLGALGGTVVGVIVLGLDPLAAALTGYFLAFFSFFQHWNVRTPQWVGYLIQRPESHCVHHRMGVHY